MSKMRAGLLLNYLAATLWGTTGITSNLIGPAANGVAVGWLRLTIAAPAFLLLSLATTGRPFPRIQSRADLLRLLACGGCMMAYQALFFQAVALGGAGLAALVAICSAPLVVAAVAAAFLGERLTGRSWLALAITLAGAVLLVGGKGSDGQHGSAADFAVAVVFALLSGTGYAIYSVITKSLTTRYAGAQLNAFSFGLAALLMLPVMLLGGRLGDVGAGGWGLLLYLGLGATFLAYFLYVRALRSIPATTASIITLAEPLTATLLSAAIFYLTAAPAFSKDQLNLTVGLGAGLMLAGLVVLSSKGMEQGRAAAAQPQGVE